MGERIAALSDMMQTGGWVMYPLLLLSLVSLSMLLERTLFWIRVHGPGSDRAFRAVQQALGSGDAHGSLKTLYARFAEAMDEPGGSPEIAAERFRPQIERWGSTLSTIITAAPLLGILGTVTGIIDSFGLLGSASVVTDPDQLAKGISEALYTTAFGLIIALFTVFPYAMFRAQAERALSRMEMLGSLKSAAPRSG